MKIVKVSIKKGFLIVLILVSLISLLDLFHSGLPMTHDGQDQVARIANFYQSLSEGNLIPRWAANLNWGFGHPILIFLYPLPSYLASFFHFFGFSLTDSTKLVFGLSFILSGVFMYLWIKEAWGEEAGFIAGLLYLFAPYRFVDLYVRGALGECWAFVWPPLICYFAIKFSRELKWCYLVGGSFSLAALILSHNALSLMFLPVIFAYLIFLIVQGDIKRKLFIIHYSLFIIFGLALSAFFWFPAFMEGKYTLRDIVTSNDFETRFRSFKDLIYSPWSYGGTAHLSVQVGFLQWLFFLSGLSCFYRLIKKKDKTWVLVGSLMLIFLISLFLITKLSLPIWQSVTLLQKFQFPWRFLSLAIFIPPVLAGIFVSFLSKKSSYFFIFGLLFFVLILNRNYWQARDFSFKDESFYSSVYAGTTDTGESSPRWSVRFMEHYSKTALELIEGRAEIQPLKRTSNRHEYLIQADVASRLVENTLYFPGWQVLIDSQPTIVEFQDPAYRGLMTFYVPAGEHQILVIFKETKLRLFADFVSLAGIFFLILSGRILKR